jgi:MerR family transcriptional regulator, heat shock protein HspR
LGTPAIAARIGIPDVSRQHNKDQGLGQIIPSSDDQAAGVEQDRGALAEAEQTHEASDDMPVYVIPVAAELSGMHPQTLRAYERLGLVSPDRRQDKSRRYSMRDILTLREIQRLSQEEGVNLTGIKLILDEDREIQKARRLIAELHAEIAQLRAELESTRAVAARLAELRREDAATRYEPAPNAAPGSRLGNR